MKKGAVPIIVAAASLLGIALLLWIGLRPPHPVGIPGGGLEARHDPSSASHELPTTAPTRAVATSEAEEPGEASEGPSAVEKLEERVRIRGLPGDWPEVVLLADGALDVFKLGSFDTETRAFGAPRDALRAAALLPGREAKEAAWLVFAAAHSGGDDSDERTWLRSIAETAQKEPAGSMGHLLGTALLGLTLLGDYGTATAVEPLVAARAAAGDEVAARAHRVCLLLDWGLLDEQRRQAILGESLDPASTGNRSYLWIRLAHEPGVPALGAMLAAARAGDAAACAGIAAISDGSLAEYLAREALLATGEVGQALRRAHFRSATAASWRILPLEPTEAAEWSKRLATSADIEDSVGIACMELANRNPDEYPSAPLLDALTRGYVACQHRQVGGAHRADVMRRMREAMFDSNLAPEDRSYVARCMVGLDPREHAGDLAALRSDSAVWRAGGQEIEEYLNSLRED